MLEFSRSLRIGNRLVCLPPQLRLSLSPLRHWTDTTDTDKTELLMLMLLSTRLTEVNLSILSIDDADILRTVSFSFSFNPRFFSGGSFCLLFHTDAMMIRLAPRKVKLSSCRSSNVTTDR
eukprot:GHVU01135174.1.p1 GENE.GHVU01135174.1~~GHVU01135174.1.p1  ORF type:complete len:120 (+),score=0.52 GHVU01135174.1:45-404(+)